jgi:crotonobetainyl-CoA:carnitine CoA-transferase CaiB-like acyl-CoA transferase
MPGPLDGIRILDITSVILGPYGTQILADQGADVIKVEAPPGGDIARNMGLLRNPGMAGIFLNMNRNKRSLALDLKEDQAKDVLRELILTADVFVHNMRPQAIARLGFDYDGVSALKPDIVYAGAYGFGQDGPYRSKPAYDDVIQAASGLASLFEPQTGEARYAPSTIADKVCGLTLSQAITAALLHKERSGEGQFVEVPMLETMASFNMVDHINGGAFEPAVGPFGYQRVTTPARRPFETKDGFVCLLPYTDQHWRSFFNAVDRPEMMEDERFSTYLARVHTINELYDFIRSVTPSRTTEEWVTACDEAQIPCMPVADIQELAKDEHLQAVKMFEHHSHASEGDTVLVRSPLKFSQSPATIRSLAPRFGEHGPELLQELGYSEAQIDALIQSKALICDSEA